MTALIETEELAAKLDDKNVRLIDGTYPPPTGVYPRIGNAVRFNIDHIADPHASLPHTVPSEEVFEHHVQNLGINNDDTLIVYDQKGMAFAAARVWWLFRLFGHKNIFILNGGLPKWLAEGRPVNEIPPAHPAPGNFKAHENAQLLKQTDDILNNISAGTFQTLDVRDRHRYESEGHIPGSQHRFFMDFIDPDTGGLKDNAEISALLKQSDIDPSRPVAVTCGSGVTACLGALALYEIGIKEASVYDGSWSEWALNPETPKTMKK